MNGSWTWPLQHPYLAAGLQGLMATVAVAFALPSLRSLFTEPGRRAARGILLASLSTLLASALVIPAFARHAFEGHEGDYLDAFTGAHPLLSAWDPFITFPAMRAFYGLLGEIPGADPSWMVTVNLLGSAVSAWALGWTAWMLFRDRGGAVGSALLGGLMVHHAFWASSAYNVMIPLAMGRMAILLALLGMRRPGASGSKGCWAAAAGLAGLATACRLEMASLFPLLAVLAVLGIPWNQMRRAALDAGPAVGMGLLTLWLHVLPLATAVEARDADPHPGYRLALLVSSLKVSSMYAPFDHPGALAVLLVGCIFLVGRGRGALRTGGTLVAILAVPHALAGTFNDFAPRHALLGGGALGMLASLGVTAFLKLRWGWAGRMAGVMVAGGILGVSLFSDLRETRQRYYANQEAFVASVPEEGRGKVMTLAQAAPEGCYILTEQGFIGEAVGASGSHFNLDPVEGPKVWREHQGCVRWLYDVDNYRWASRDVHSRATRLKSLLIWREEGWLVTPEGFSALVYCLDQPPPTISRILWGFREGASLEANPLAPSRCGDHE